MTRPSYVPEMVPMSFSSPVDFQRKYQFMEEERYPRGRTNGSKQHRAMSVPSSNLFKYPVGEVATHIAIWYLKSRLSFQLSLPAAPERLFRRGPRGVGDPRRVLRPPITPIRSRLAPSSIVAGTQKRSASSVSSSVSASVQRANPLKRTARVLFRNVVHNGGTFGRKRSGLFQAPTCSHLFNGAAQFQRYGLVVNEDANKKHLFNVVVQQWLFQHAGVRVDQTKCTADENTYSRAGRTVRFWVTPE